ncbi:MAG: UDP-glucose--hexose-1-phosphate uridylyltransferase [Clostridia bacterium]|nr:UDP-glucose--hexose-1-phosphate uridylyltransferase [Clostridia bacterium]
MTTQQIFKRIHQLTEYALANGLILKEDVTYTHNALIGALGLDAYEEVTDAEEATIEEILADIDDFAFETGLIPDNGVTQRDLFDAKIMGLLTPRPSMVIEIFKTLYAESPEKATDWYYAFSKATDYIRTYRIKKDLKWSVPSVYGEIDITVNLSKPEKDPKAIAAAKALPQSGYPKCALCAENEGYAGNLRAAARQNHRIIPMTMAGEDWFLQYSPYVYYNEHCIALSADHCPMKIEKDTFRRLLDFEELFPHYFIGSNADLPIVGGSILSHNHFQGGHYTFAMETAPIEKEITFKGFENVKAGIVKWPLSVIRISSKDKNELVELADKILLAWRGYTDENAFVFAETNGEPHNTITPIARRRNGDFELDLVLRNNITTEEHPLGVYHPHAELHNIKKENIGLIEVMGLAVLPARLKAEMATLEDALINGKDISADESIAKHADWVEKFRANYTFTAENTAEILRAEIGKTFVLVLEDAGVYKCTDDGRAAFVRFVDYVNN